MACRKRGHFTDDWYSIPRNPIFFQLILVTWTLFTYTCRTSKINAISCYLTPWFGNKVYSILIIYIYIYIWSYILYFFSHFIHVVCLRLQCSQELPKNYVKMSVIITSCVSVAMSTSSDDKSSGPDPGTFCVKWSDLWRRSVTSPRGLRTIYCLQTLEIHWKYSWRNFKSIFITYVYLRGILFWPLIYSALLHHALILTDPISLLNKKLGQFQQLRYYTYKTTRG